MDKHKHYTIGLLFLIGIQILALLAASWYLDPVVGDETRLGGFAENDFGWNEPQKSFSGQAPPLYQAYEQYSDVLVVGDSFSFAGNYDISNYPWQTFLRAKTGFSVATINHYIRKVSLTYDSNALPKIVNSEAFQNAPPRVLIMEIVERNLGLLYDLPDECQAQQGPATGFNLNPIPDLMPSVEIHRKKAPPPLREHLSYAKRYLIQLLWKLDKNPIVSRLDLATANLFSSRRSGEVLIIGGDIEKRAWDEARLARIRCQLIKMQNFVQKNGRTLFVAMLVPDKLTAYAKYLQDQSLANLGVIERLASDPALHMVRVDRAIEAAVDAGLVDVYLPNDTHWSYRGHEIAAEAVAQYLKNFMGG